MEKENKKIETLQTYINWYRARLIEVMERNQKASTLPPEELNGKYSQAYTALQKDLMYYANMYLRLIVHEGFYCDGGWSTDQYSRYGEVVSSPALKSRTDPLLEAGKLALMGGDFAGVQKVAMDIRAEVAAIIKRLGGREDEGEAAVIADGVNSGKGVAIC